ncbi:MAG: hypothetical protein PHS92_03070 [Candidatus Gracilibacteria bacterium]|nr:hypothetical protein [Candidatus Gracilibacteria bacterium]
MIILDIETSSADPYNGSLLSIGAVEFENPRNQFYGECKAYEGADIQERALEVNGFTIEQVTDRTKQTVLDLIYNFMQWSNKINDRTIGGHNVGYFDLRFIEENANKMGLVNNFGLLNGNYRTLDLHTIAYSYLIKNKIEIPMKNNQSSLNLDYVLGLVGLPMEPRPHNGLNGAKYEAEAFSRFLYGKKLLPEFEKYDLPENFNF